MKQIQNFFIIFLLVLVGCGKSEIVLNKEDKLFTDMMLDVYLANTAASLIEIPNKDSARQVLINTALDYYKSDTILFSKKLSEYEKDPIRLKIMMDTVEARLERMQGELMR